MKASRYYAYERLGRWYVMARSTRRNSSGDQQLAECYSKSTAVRIARALDAVDTERVREAPRGRTPSTGRLSG